MNGWGRARGQAGTWPIAPGAAHRSAPRWPARLSELAQQALDALRHWIVLEAAPGRLMPWLPVAFGLGIAVYFTADREPAWWAALALTTIFCTITLLVRARPIAFPIMIGFTAMAAGFATGIGKTSFISHPVLRHPVTNIDIAGWVEVREVRERTDRIVVKVNTITGRKLEDQVERVRLSVRKGTAPAVGTYIALNARLNPPLAPLRPGGYDFARDLYYQGIGATGFAMGEIRAMPSPAKGGVWLRYLEFFDQVRSAVDQRIRAVAPGDAGAIASALITGTRDALSGPVNDAMYISSLAHVLSISGYHMAVVAGAVFFIIRGFLALIPGLVLRYPIKKWAALAALLAATFYLLLSGLDVATQRSYYMTAIVLCGVMLDRTVLTLRTLGIAAMAVLVLVPEALVHPSFQMSFAATLALVSGYARGLQWKSKNADTSIGARIALWGVKEVMGLLFASLVAGLATTPYAAFHFHRMAPYGVLANLLAMPIVSAWIMPAGMLALVAMPFGFDGVLWRLMADGIEWMDKIALWVASLPGAVGRLSAFGVGPLIVCTGGLLILCMLRSPLRWGGAILLGLGTIWIILTPAPDVLIAQDSNTMAVRTASGQLAMIKRGGDGFSVREWLAADADARVVSDPTLGEGFACEEAGCAARLADGAIVTLAQTAEAFEDDCIRAALIVTSRATPPPDCAASIIDRKFRAGAGSLALRHAGNGWEIMASRSEGYDRPWAHPRSIAPLPTAGPAVAQGRSGQSPAGPRDATPRPEDIDPE